MNIKTSQTKFKIHAIYLMFIHKTTSEEEILHIHSQTFRLSNVTNFKLGKIHSVFFSLHKCVIVVTN
jgi:hypothetical protein